MNKSSSSSTGARAILAGLSTFSALLATLAWAPAAHAAAPVRDEASCGTRRIEGAPRLPRDGEWFGTQPTKVYLNKNGGTIQLVNGAGDAAQNRVYGGFFGGTGTANVSPLDTNIYDWDYIKACVADHFSDFAIEVVDVEPGAGVRYVEAVVGGNAGQMGLSSSVLGIAAADNFCDLTVRGMCFSFSEGHDDYPAQIRSRELCGTVAHEVGHLLGLEHEQLHNDLMCYDFSNTKSFLDQNATCGEYDTDEQQSPRQCSCGGNSTNSYARLEDIIGLRPTESTPPQVSITEPSNGDTVPRGFLVRATATDNDQMRHVTLFIDGNQVGQDPTPDGSTYVMSAPTGLGEGPHTVTVEATDRSGNVSRDEIQINVTLACDCSNDYACVNGECKLLDGRACTDGSQCAGTLCASGPDGMFCTETCDPANDACPQGLSCTTIGSGQAICTPNGDPLVGEDGGDGGCGCQVGGRNDGLAGGAFGLGALAVGFAMFLQRRRRRAR